MQLELDNIRITNVCPGPVKTQVSYSALTGMGDVYGKEDPMIEGGMKADRSASHNPNVVVLHLSIKKTLLHCVPVLYL